VKEGQFRKGRENEQGAKSQALSSTKKIKKKSGIPQKKVKDAVRWKSKVMPWRGKRSLQNGQRHDQIKPKKKMPMNQKEARAISPLGEV